MSPTFFPQYITIQDFSPLPIFHLFKSSISMDPETFQDQFDVNEKAPAVCGKRRPDGQTRGWAASFHNKR